MKAATAVIGAMIGVVLLFVFGTGVLDKRGRPTQLCDNSLCVTAPAGWYGEMYYGGISSQLAVAPFSFPEGEGSPPTPAGKFQILIENYRRYRFGWPRGEVISIGRDDIRQTHQRNSSSSAQRRVYFHGHSLAVSVSFGDANPSSEEIAAVNGILSTIRRRPPPKPTQ